MQTTTIPLRGGFLTSATLLAGRLSRFFGSLPSMRYQVFKCPCHRGGIVAQTADADVAKVAEQPSHLSGFMVMIDVRLAENFPADGAQSVLCFHQEVKVVDGER